MGERVADFAARAFLASQMPRKLLGVDDDEYVDRRERREDDDDDDMDDEDDVLVECDDGMDEDGGDGKGVRAFFSGAKRSAADAWESSGPAGKVAFVVGLALLVILVSFLVYSLASCCCCCQKKEDDSNEFESLEAPQRAAPRPDSPSSPRKPTPEARVVESTPVQPYRPEQDASQGIPVQPGATYQGVPYQPSAGYAGPVPLIQVVTMERPRSDMPPPSQ